jgi:hypothetical protein
VLSTYILQYVFVFHLSSFYFFKFVRLGNKIEVSALARKSVCLVKKPELIFVVTPSHSSMDLRINTLNISLPAK